MSIALIRVKRASDGDILSYEAFNTLTGYGSWSKLLDKEFGDQLAYENLKDSDWDSGYEELYCEPHQIGREASYEHHVNCMGEDSAQSDIIETYRELLKLGGKAHVAKMVQGCPEQPLRGDC